MGFLVLAFDSSIPTGSVLVDCKSIVDAGVATQSGDGYVLDARMKLLLGAYAFGANIKRAQIQTPKFNLLAYQEVTALNQAAAAAYERNKLDFYLDGARSLAETETLITQVYQGGTAAENDRVLVWLCDTLPTPVKKDHFTIRFTGSATLTADAWSTVTPTLDRNLPAGKYQIIGARLNSAGGIGFRVNIPGYNFRPGGVCVQNDQALDPEGQRHGGWGVWGEFEQNLLPVFDVLSTSADTSQSGELDLIKV